MTQEEQWILNEKYAGNANQDFLADCKKLRAGVPLAYIIGSIPFLHTTIYLDSHPLIPRPETEYWLEKVLPIIRTSGKEDGSVHVLDLCAGSGCIGVAVLSDIPESTVDFAEIDKKHHPLITKNVIENTIDISRTHIFGGDLFTECIGLYDVILSNPPYIDKARNRTDASVIAHEPAQALYGGKDGMEIIENIIQEAPTHLTPTGILIIEHEPEQTNDIKNIAHAHSFSAQTKVDQYEVERYTILERSK